MSAETQATILIVDDTPANLGVLFDFLANSKFKVLIAQSGKSAIQKVEYAAPDLILLDVLMPEMDGFETCQQLKSQDRIKDIPVIFMTALSDPVDKVKGLQLGAVDYITKPLQHEELLARIKLHLDLRNLTKQLQEKNLQLEQQIQERTLAEEALRQSEMQLRLLADALPVMISYIDFDHYYRFVNRGYEDWYDLPRSEIQDRPIAELLSEAAYQKLRPNLVLALSGQPVTFENSLIRKGKLHHLLVNYVPHFNEDKVMGTYALIQDITERKQLEQQLLRSQRMESIGTLASGIAHDLNNILTPILMAVQLLAMKYQDKQSQQWLEILETNTKRGADLLRQVMSFARGMDGSRIPIQPKQLIWEIQQIVEETFPKSITISTDVASQLWSVSGDSTQLHQVLMNLCLNARDAMPNGGSLQLSAENLVVDAATEETQADLKMGPYVVLTVTDTGTGIAADQIERIFDPFFTTKELGQGTGLGLSNVIGIVKSHGGVVTVSSQVGQGTQFQVFLPAIAAPVAGVAEKDVDLPFGHGETVLIVDDEAAIREIAQRSLEAYGYQVLTANNGLEAVTIYTQHQEIDLVLMDMMMPSMDGSLAIRTLKAINPRLKIVAVSGLISREQLSDLTGTDVHGFLPKPFTSQDLLTILNQVVQLEEED